MRRAEHRFQSPLPEQFEIIIVKITAMLADALSRAKIQRKSFTKRELRSLTFSTPTGQKKLFLART
jgi:hypothetical protein